MDYSVKRNRLIDVDTLLFLLKFEVMKSVSRYNKTHREKENGGKHHIIEVPMAQRADIVECAGC